MVHVPSPLARLRRAEAEWLHVEEQLAAGQLDQAQAEETAERIEAEAIAARRELASVTA